MAYIYYRVLIKMKQHITVKQACEVNKKKTKTVCDWLEKKGHSLPHKGSPTVSILLSIGQMIEFLDEHSPVTLSLILMNCAEEMDFSKLTDKLWKAVKEE